MLTHILTWKTTLATAKTGTEDPAHRVLEKRLSCAAFKQKYSKQFMNCRVLSNCIIMLMNFYDMLAQWTIISTLNQFYHFSYGFSVKES